MIVKQVKNFGSGQAELRKGMNILADAVCSTLGPEGRPAFIESENAVNGLIISKDGVTVAKSIALENPIENMAVQIMKQAADRTAIVAGDGPQPLSSKILTPTGWTTMGEIKEGDNLCGTNGSIQNVLGVFDKGNREILNVVFSDGRIVECCEDHLWNIKTNYGVNKTLTTRDMFNRGAIELTPSGSKKHNFYVPNTVVDFKENNLELDPYLLGVLIGDGSLSGSGSIEISIGFNKEHILEKLILPEGITFNTSRVESKKYLRVKFIGMDSKGRYLKDILNDIGLFGTLSKNKFIPKNYLYSNISSRSSLLKGLLDTDGCINKRGLFEFSTISDLLFNDFLDLVRGLGYQTHSYKMDRKENSSYSNTPIYRVTQIKGYKHGLKIVGIIKTGNYTDMKCIKVSNEDNLYITDGYIPTHNTTTSICLTRAILEESYEQIDDEKHNKSEVIRAIVDVSKIVEKNLTSASKKITDKRLLDVATISANNDKVTGKLIADAYKKASLVTVENSMTTESYFETIEGIKINRGFSSKFFITDHKKNEAVLDNAMVLITDQEINTLESIEPVLAFCVQNNKPLFIIGELAPAVLNTLNMNVLQKRIKFGNCIPPAMGYRKEELLTDLAVALGAKYYSERTGDILTSISVDGLGFAKKVIIGQENTIVIRSEESDNVSLDDHINQLKESIATQKNPSAIDFLNERIANISGGISVIHVGAETDIEQKELYDRVEDAVLAVRASLEEGILPGGGIGLINACANLEYKNNEDYDVAVDIITKALEHPFNQILENAGIENITPIVAEIVAQDKGIGYNVKTKQVGDMIQMGIIDPAKVTKSALKNAVSVATTILSTSTIISNIRA